MRDPIAYTYEADTHCPSCALDRFGPEPGRGWVRDDATDAEGNPVGAVFPWDEWCESSEPGRAILACGTCGDILDEHWHTGTLCIDAEVYAMVGDGPTCAQCGGPLGPVGAMLGPVCGTCARTNHRAMLAGHPIGSSSRPSMIGGVPFVTR